MRSQRRLPCRLTTLMYLLELTKSGRDRIRRYVLGDEPVTIGRSSSNTIPLSDHRVSRRHCTIELLSGKPHVRDLGSRHGVRVNSTRRRKRTLRLGDMVQIGPYSIFIADRLRNRDSRSNSDDSDASASSADLSAHAHAVERPDDSGGDSFSGADVDMAMSDPSRRLRKEIDQLREDLTQAKRQLAAATEQHDADRQASRKELETLRDERRELSSRVAELAPSLEDRTSHLTDALEQLDSVTRDRDQVREELRQKDNAESSASDAIEALERECQDLRSQLDESLASLQMREETTARLTTERDEVDRTLRELRTEQERESSERETLRVHIESLEQELANAEERRADAEAIEADLRDQIASLEEVQQEARAQSNDQEVAALTGERDALLSERDALSAERSELAQAVAALEDDLHHVRGDCSLLNGRARAAEEELNRVRTDADRRDQVAARFAEERDSVRDELDALRDQHEETMQELATTRNALVEAEARVIGLQSDVADVEGRHADEVRALSERVRKLESACEALNEASDEAEALKGRLSEAADARMALDEELRQSRERNVSLLTELTDVRSALQQARHELASIREQKSPAARAEVAASPNGHGRPAETAVSPHATERDPTVEELIRRRREAEGRIRALQSKLTQAKKEIVSLHGRLRQKEQRFIEALEELYHDHAVEANVIEMTEDQIRAAERHGAQIIELDVE